MMYLEKPVVATGWSANMDFMTAENSFPVRYQLKPLEHGVGPYAAGLNWAEADVDHAADCIARLIESPELRQRIGRQASHDIRRQLSPQAVGALVQERLSLLGFWHPELRP
jgi:glycosyltransferase involved in cell wall biosynthesis